MESQRGRLSPSSPSSSRSIPFRSSDSDDHTETDALLSDMDSHSAWMSHGRAVSEGSSSNPHRPLLHHPLVASGDASGHTSLTYTYPDQPPPSFAPYEAEYFEVGNEDICSHDPHLNSDGEALYRFILARAQRPPFLRVHITGTHTEHKTRWVTRSGNDGRSRQELENYSENVTDFSFCIDIKPVVYTTRTSDGSVGGQIPIDPVHWSVADHVPAYRGKMVKEVEETKVPGLGAVRRERRKCKRKERKVRERWQEEIQGKGLPPWCEEYEVDFESISSLALSGSNSNPWVESLAEVERNPLRSSKTIRQWADDYCASPKKLKEFVYIQELYGWNIQQIESAIRTTILATPYNGDLDIQFTKYRSRIYIRPDNRLSRMLSNKWLKFISIILFIYPFIWLFKRFHSRGGGRWEVCGGAYPLKRWVPLEQADEPGGPTRSSGNGSGDSTLPPYAAHAPAYSDSPQPASEATWTHNQLRRAGMLSDIPRTPMSIATAATPGSFDHHPFAAPGSLTRTRSSSSRVMQTASGPKKLLGVREGEWFKRWEHTITRAVLVRYQSHEPLHEPGAATDSVLALDGYTV